MGRRGRLLTRGFAPQSGFTPLHSAVYEGHPEVVKLLLVAGANKDAPIQVRERRVGGCVGRT